MFILQNYVCKCICVYIHTYIKAGPAAGLQVPPALLEAHRLAILQIGPLEPHLPLTTKTMILVGSYYEALYRIYRQPRKMMVLVANATPTWTPKVCKIMAFKLFLMALSYSVTYSWSHTYA